MSGPQRLLAFATLVLGVGCVGQVSPGKPMEDQPDTIPPRGRPAPGAPGSLAEPPTTSAPDPLASPREFGPSLPRRLSREELAQSIQDLLGVDVRAEIELLPPDAGETLFDNDQHAQTASPALVGGLRTVAEAAARRFVSLPAERRAEISGCRPRDAADDVCFRTFVTRVGRRTLRRPLEPEEIDRLAEARRFSAEAGDFWVGVEVVLQALLQDPEFVWRIEKGTPVPAAPALARLTGFEIAARLSYMLWGSLPDDDLLDAAARGALAHPEGVATAAARLLRDPRAAAHLRRLHAQWLSYQQIPASPALASAMRREADALVTRVIDDPDASWLSLFTARETYVDTALAELYGLQPPVSGEGWVSWSPDRRGLLSQAAVLANGEKQGRTSLALRGLYVWRRLLCRPTPVPPPAAAEATTTPPPGTCKAAAVREHTRRPDCAGCHRPLDALGLGLEGYDVLGVARTEDETGCPVTSAGEVPLADGSAVPFSGPAALADVLVRTGALESCFVQQLLSYTLGRTMGPRDDVLQSAVQARFRQHGYRLRRLLQDLAASPAFQHRVEETP